MTLPNLTLEALNRLSPADLRELPVAVLADLQKQLNDANAVLERRAAVLWTSLNERFAAQAQKLRHADGRDTGTVHLLVDGHDVACSTSKRVEWDRTKLLEALANLGEAEQKIYLRAKLSVPEETFQHAPPAIKALLEPARTMKPTKETFTLTQKE